MKPIEMEFTDISSAALARVDRFRSWVVLPLLGLGLSSLVFATSLIDLSLARLFYDDATESWPAKGSFMFQLLYVYGPIPGVLVCILGALLLVRGLITRRVDRHLRVGIFLVLSFLLGPGLIVNVVMKNHWGRPRPLEVQEFGGSFQFAHLGELGTAGRNCSFPCGHASSAFFVAVGGLALLALERKRAGVILFITGSVFGILVGVARMAQGAHFLSDILWSAGIVYFTALFVADCARLFEFGPNGRPLIPRQTVLDRIDDLLVKLVTRQKTGDPQPVAVSLDEIACETGSTLIQFESRV